MAEYSYEEYLKNSVQNKSTEGNGFQKVGYFKLVDDGDFAIVRFAYSSTKEMNLVNVHNTKVGDSYRRVSCLRRVGAPLEDCPFCSAGDEKTGKLSSKFYVKLIEYKQDDNGNILVEPKVWERPAKFASKIAEYINEYGDLKDNIFKIVRKGKKGDMQTDYEVIFLNPMKYNEESGFKKDFSAFDNFDLSKHSYYVKTKEEMKEFIRTGSFPEKTDKFSEIPSKTISDADDGNFSIMPSTMPPKVQKPQYGADESHAPEVQPNRPRRNWNFED